MAGSLVTLRTAGWTAAGYPVDIDTDVKIRSVDTLLVNMREQSVDFLKYIGGPTSFTFNNTKREWIEDDLWSRRITGCTAAGGAGAQALELGADIAFRFPVGTLFKCVDTDQLLRVTVVAPGADASVLTVVEAVAAAVVTAILATYEVKVAGQAMAANAVWSFRPGSILSPLYNYGQVMTDAIEVTYDRMETDIYGLQGSDLDYLAANAVAENFVKMEGMLLDGKRSYGIDADHPALAGGVKFYVTAGNGAQVTNLADVALTRKDLDDKLQALWYAVGPEKMARTCLISGWGKRKISSWFSSAERLSPPAGTAGIVIDRINTDFGAVDFLLHTALDKDELLLLNRENIKMGCHGNLGRPHLMIPAGVDTTGPYVKRFYYAHLTVQCKGVQGMGRIHNFSVTA